MGGKKKEKEDDDNDEEKVKSRSVISIEKYLNKNDFMDMFNNFINDCVFCKNCGNYEGTRVIKDKKTGWFFCCSHCQDKVDYENNKPNYYLTFTP